MKRQRQASKSTAISSKAVGKRSKPQGSNQESETIKEPTNESGPEYPTVRVKDEDIVLVKVQFDVPFFFNPAFNEQTHNVPLVNTYGYTTDGIQRLFEEDLKLSENDTLKTYLQTKFPGIHCVVVELNCYTDWLESLAPWDIIASLKHICPLFGEYLIGLDCERIQDEEGVPPGDGTLSAYDAILGMIVLRALDAGYRTIDTEDVDWFRGDHFRVV